MISERDWPHVYDNHSPRVPEMGDMMSLLKLARERLSNAKGLDQTRLRAHIRQPLRVHIGISGLSSERLRSSTNPPQLSYHRFWLLSEVGVRRLNQFRKGSRVTRSACPIVVALGDRRISVVWEACRQMRFTSRI
jgi:hypothetical protein